MDQGAALRSNVRFDHQVALKHLGPKRYAELLEVTIPEMRALVKAAPPSRMVRWSKVSKVVLRAAFEDFVSNREIATRWCARHKYSASGFSAAVKEHWADEWAAQTVEKRPEAGRLYKIGRDLEYRTRKHLMEAGFFALRAPASKTKVDVFAARAGEILVIQCKRNGYLPTEEWNTLVEIAHQVGGKAIVVEHPYAGQTNWWELTDFKVERGVKHRVPYPQPIRIREVSDDELDDEADAHTDTEEREAA